MLPDDCGTLLSWPQQDATKLLAGSGLAAKAADILNAADATCRELAPIVREAEAKGMAEAGVFTGGAAMAGGPFGP